MATHVESEPDVAVTLVGGIVEDARQLIVEQMTLFQVEIKNDLHRTINGIIPLAAGAVVIVVGLIILGIAGSHLLCWAFPELPLWAGFAIVGGIVTAVGAALAFWGKSMLDRVHLTPDESLKGLKENIQWKMKK